MPTRQVFTWSGTVTATGDCPVSFDPIDLSLCRSLRAELRLTGAAAAAGGDMLNVYLMNRWQDGVYHDRAAFTQLIGTDLSGKEAFVQLQGTGSDYQAQERAGTLFGVADVGHLGAGNVLNGPFPPLLRRGNTAANVTGGLSSVGNLPTAPWKFRFVVASASAPSFPVQLVVWAEFAERSI